MIYAASMIYAAELSAAAIVFSYHAQPLVIRPKRRAPAVTIIRM
jgi:hypothetical protein